MTFAGTIVVETFDRGGPAAFDHDRDLAARAAALAAANHPGYDNVAGVPTEFELRGIGFREDMFSGASAASARQRTLTCGISLALFGVATHSLTCAASVIAARNGAVYLTETTTPLYRCLEAALPAGSLFASEYRGDDHAGGSFVDGVRHEDLQRLSFADEAFELIITSEVLEHVPDANLAEREIVRVLRPGGSYVFTVPLDPYGEADTVLAQRDADGSLRFFGEPVYHGDPLRAEGILAYRIFAVADLERRFAALGCTLATYRIWSTDLGILGSDSFVHVARKNVLCA